jgi:2-haloacid dehalogenase
MRLTDFKALTFDCYGTLIDWETGLIRALKPLAAKPRRKPSREEILQAFARHESFQESETPAKNYRDLLATVYRRLAEEWNVEVSWSECVGFSRSVRNWPAFADTATALRYLKKHYRLIILSNVDNESFAASNRKLKVRFDAIYTAEDIGSYKPAKRNFDYMLAKLETLGIEKSDILHTAQSLFHDHAPANRQGVASCWIDRRHQKEGFGATSEPGTLPSYDFRFTSMAELAKAHRAESAKRST